MHFPHKTYEPCGLERKNNWEQGNKVAFFKILVIQMTQGYNMAILRIEHFVKSPVLSAVGHHLKFPTFPLGRFEPMAYEAYVLARVRAAVWC